MPCSACSISDSTADSHSASPAQSFLWVSRHFFSRLYASHSYRSFLSFGTFGRYVVRVPGEIQRGGRTGGTEVNREGGDVSFEVGRHGLATGYRYVRR